MKRIGGCAFCRLARREARREARKEGEREGRKNERMTKGMRTLLYAARLQGLSGCRAPFLLHVVVAGIVCAGGFGLFAFGEL